MSIILNRKSVCQCGLFALRWSTVLVECTLQGTEEAGVDYNGLVLAQANLLASITAYGEEAKNRKAYRMVSAHALQYNFFISFLLR